MLKWAIFLDYFVGIGYNLDMLGGAVFILRLGLIVAFWGFIWSCVKPRTLVMRVLRAALLVVVLLSVLAVLRITGG